MGACLRREQIPIRIPHGPAAAPGQQAGRHGQCINALDPVYNEFFLCAPVRARNPRGQGQWTLRDACLRFLADSAVPFTNNGAEQAVRMAKPRMKISGGFRTRAGAERLARMRGLVETARQRQQNLLELLWQGPDIPGPHAHGWRDLTFNTVAE